MKNPRDFEFLAALLVFVGLLAGCASMDPARVRSEMQRLTDARQFDAARAVKAKSDPAGITKSEEEKAKEQMIREVVDPTEIQYRTGEDSRKVREFVSSRKYDDARDLLWTPLPSLVPAVRGPVAENREKLLHETVNRTQFIRTTNDMAKAVAAAVARKDFAAARKALADVRPVRVYPKALNEALDGVRKSLVASGVSAGKAEKIVSEQLMRVFEVLFPDPLYRARTVKPGEVFQPDDERYVDALDAFRKTLGEYGVDGSHADKICKTVDALASDLLKELWRPQKEFEITPPDAIGTTKLNELLWTAKTNILETVIVPAQKASLKARAVALLKAGKFDEARVLLESAGEDGDEIAETAKDILEKVLVPAQVASRAKELRDKVVPLVHAGRLDEARAAIHAYGVTGFPEVDDPVFAVKLGLLNARVNLAEWTARSEALSKSVGAALADCNPKQASDIVAADRPVAVYGAPVDEVLDAAAVETARLGFDESGARAVVADAQGKLCEIVAPRPESAREARIMQAYLDEVAGIADERRSDDPDWSSVRKALDAASAWLVKDDFAKDEADALMSDVLSGFKALASGTGDAGPTALTTEELNRRLSGLKADLSAKITAAVTAMSKAAEIVDEAPSLSSEELSRRLEKLRKFATVKVSPEFADKLLRDTTAAVRERIEAAKAAKAAAKAEADVKAAAARAEAERLRQLALEMAERAAAAVDFDARINGFVEAVSERSEPDINRVLGDGARILRLRRVGAALSRDDATSLLVAAVYMGYDDVMNLAIVLGADVDGASTKDELRRTPLLIALQFGFKGRAAAVLEKADRRIRDARGDGTLHYAVRGGDGTALVSLLRAGVSAKRTGAGGATPIVLAADLGYAGFVQALAPFSDLEKADEEGFTALLRAAQNGRLDIVRNLVAAGAELGAKTEDGDGALELAAKANSPDLLAWLLDEIKVAPTDRVVSQLVLAGNVPTLQIMVAHGARLQDAHLADAVKLGDFPMVKYLVDQGMDVNAEVVKAVRRESCDPGEGQNADPANEDTCYGPDGELIAAFLREQGQR